MLNIFFLIDETGTEMYLLHVLRLAAEGSEGHRNTMTCYWIRDSMRAEALDIVQGKANTPASSFCLLTETVARTWEQHSHDMTTHSWCMPEEYELREIVVCHFLREVLRRRFLCIVCHL